MRRQVKAALIFNGHTIQSVDEIDEDTFNDICVMYGDGVLGGRAVYDALTPLTTAVFNYIRKPESTPFKADGIFPWVNEYNKNPELELTEEDKTNQALLVFMSQAPGFKMERFNNVQQ